MSKYVKGPYLPNIGPYSSNDPYAAAGLAVDPNTGLVIGTTRQTSIPTKCELYNELKRLDRLSFIQRFKWQNMPLPSEQIERLLYRYGQVCFFYSEDLNQFFVLPFTQDGPIDVYGRPTYIKPIPISSGDEDKDNKVLATWLESKRLKVRHEVVLPEDIVDDMNILTESAVIIKDYTPFIGEYVKPRSLSANVFLDLESDCLPFMHTALLNSTGVLGMRVNSDEEQASVEAASNAINKAALEGRKYVGIVGQIDFQELTSGTTNRAEEFLLAMQSVDNMRLSSLGVNNGGIFQKKEHMLGAEQKMNQGNASLILQDSLNNRQSACNIINSIWWALDVTCDASEAASGIDTNGDVQPNSEYDQSGSGNYNEQIGGDEYE